MNSHAAEVDQGTTGTLHDSPGHQLRRVYQNMAATFSRLTRDYDISNVQFAALKGIEALEPATQRDVARYIAMEPSNMHSLVRRLEERGLIRMRADRGDRRRSEITLSDAGRAMLAEVGPLEARVASGFLEALSDNERARFLRLLKKLAFAGTRKDSARGD